MKKVAQNQRQKEESSESNAASWENVGDRTGETQTSSDTSFWGWVEKILGWGEKLMPLITGIFGKSSTSSVNGMAAPRAGIVGINQNTPLNALGQPRIRTETDSVVVTHSELVGDITMPVGATEGTLIYELECNPTRIADSWMGRFAELYETYKYRKLAFCFVSNLAATETGAILGYIDRDPADEVEDEIAVVSNLRKAASHVGAREVKVWDNAFWPMPPTGIMKGPFFTGVQGEDNRLTSMGRFRLYSCGVPSVSLPCVIGQLFVCYEIELHLPQLGEPRSGAGLCITGGSTSRSILRPFGVDWEYLELAVDDTLEVQWTDTLDDLGNDTGGLAQFAFSEGVWLFYVAAVGTGLGAWETNAYDPNQTGIEPLYPAAFATYSLVNAGTTISTAYMVAYISKREDSPDGNAALAFSLAAYTTCTYTVMWAMRLPGMSRVSQSTQSMIAMLDQVNRRLTNDPIKLPYMTDANRRLARSRRKHKKGGSLLKSKVNSIINVTPVAQSVPLTPEKPVPKLVRTKSKQKVEDDFDLES
jgi:hypothetical protein